MRSFRPNTGYGLVFGRMRMEEGLDFCANARTAGDDTCLTGEQNSNLDFGDASLCITVGLRFEARRCREERWGVGQAF